jgi:hypothetical protein
LLPSYSRILPSKEKQAEAFFYRRFGGRNAVEIVATNFVDGKTGWNRESASTAVAEYFPRQVIV